MEDMALKTSLSQQFHNHAGTARLEEITLPGNRLSVLSVTTVDDKMFSLRTAYLVFLSSGIRKTERVESQMKPRKPKTAKEWTEFLYQ